MRANSAQWDGNGGRPWELIPVRGSQSERCVCGVVGASNMDTHPYMMYVYHCSLANHGLECFEWSNFKSLKFMFTTAASRVALGSSMSNKTPPFDRNSLHKQLDKVHRSQSSQSCSGHEIYPSKSPRAPPGLEPLWGCEADGPDPEAGAPHSP